VIPLRSRAEAAEAALVRQSASKAGQMSSCSRSSQRSGMSQPSSLRSRSVAVSGERGEVRARPGNRASAPGQTSAYVDPKYRRVLRDEAWREEEIAT